MNFCRPIQIFLGFLFLGLSSATSVATAQNLTPEFKIGVAATTLRGESTADFRIRTGFAGGVGFRYRFRHGLSVMPELLYVVKGTQADFVLSDQGLLLPVREGGSEGVPIRANFEFTYVEIPVLVVFRLETNGRVHPKVFAGPSLSFLLDAKVRFRALSGGPEQEESDSTVEGVDYGAVIGGGLEFDVGGQRLSFGARASYGLANTRKRRSSPLRNTSFIFFTGVVF